VLAQPPVHSGKRQWVHLGPSSENAVVLVSYNILADGPGRALSSKHACCPLEWRTWEDGEEGGRLARIVRELQGFDADILCLQECVPRHFEEIQERLGRKYVGIHVSQVLNSNSEDQAEVERGEMGNAVFVRAGLSVEAAQGVAFRDCLGERHTGRLRQRLVGLEDSILLVKVESLGGPLCIGTTHLHFDPNWPHVKVCQAEMAIRALHKFANAAGGGPPAVLCGDFNSLPVSQTSWLPQVQRDSLPPHEDWNPAQRESAVLSLLTRGGVDEKHPEHPDAFGRPKDEPTNQCGELTSPIYLVDTYSAVSTPWTTNAADFAGRIDYIFVTPKIQCSAVYAVPSSLDPIPDATYPSDHLSLAVSLRLN
jgi:endonuclease/exonuclease/phosphatase family metal-dependent hydrolase